MNVGDYKINEPNDIPTADWEQVRAMPRTEEAAYANVDFNDPESLASADFAFMCDANATTEFLFMEGDVLCAPPTGTGAGNDFANKAPTAYKCKDMTKCGGENGQMNPTTFDRTSASDADKATFDAAWETVPPTDVEGKMFIVKEKDKRENNVEEECWDFVTITDPLYDGNFELAEGDAVCKNGRVYKCNNPEAGACSTMDPELDTADTWLPSRSKAKPLTAAQMST